MIKEINIENIKELFRERNKEANKGDFGKIGILGGSINYSGAIKLANLSLTSLRSGCGLVRIIVPSKTVNMLGPYILEQTIFTYDSLEDIQRAITDLNVLAVGMGWASKAEHLDILKYILINFKGKIIIDADGLNTLVGHLDLLKSSKANILLTPHLKEFSRLTNIPIKEIKGQETSLTYTFAKENNVTVLLKGSTTVITDGKDIYLTKYGTPGMATSGSGDVLSGIVAGLLGYLELRLLTISAGAILNGLSGEIATEKYTDISMISRDTINCIPQAIKEIRKGEK